MIRSRAVQAAFVAALLVATGEVAAQQVSSYCVANDNKSSCVSRFLGRVGSACTCVAPSTSTGIIRLPPPNTGNACATPVGICQVNYQAMGSPCACSNGGRGQIVRR